MNKFHKFFIEVAKEASTLSYANRKKVGAILVKKGNIIAFGYNGTPHGFENKCEDEEGKTKKDVIHAEINAIAKVASSTHSTKNSSLYVTLSPCHDCAKIIIQSKIKEVFYLEEYRDSTGLEILKKAGINCIKL